MRPEYDGVKFYSKNDWSISDQLKEAEPIIESFNTDRNWQNVSTKDH